MLPAAVKTVQVAPFVSLNCAVNRTPAIVMNLVTHPVRRQLPPRFYLAAYDKVEDADVEGIERAASDCKKARKQASKLAKADEKARLEAAKAEAAKAEAAKAEADEKARLEAAEAEADEKARLEAAKAEAAKAEAAKAEAAKAEAAKAEAEAAEAAEAATSPTPELPEGRRSKRIADKQRRHSVPEGGTS